MSRSSLGPISIANPPEQVDVPAARSPLRSGALNVEARFREIHRRGDHWLGVIVAAHLLIGFALAPFHGTWTVAAVVGGAASLLFAVSVLLWPGRLVTRMVAGVSLQAFVALHIHQMAGLAEMHFFFFTSVTALIIYKDWRAPWPGVFVIIAQHALFHHLHNRGIHPGGLPFFEPEHVTDLRMAFHYGIALSQVAIASYCAHALGRRALRDTLQQVELAQANLLLEQKQGELERANRHLQENTEQLQEVNRELRDSEQRFRSTFDQAAVGVAHVGLDGSWLRMNDRFCRITGYTRTEMLRLTFQQITHPDDLALDLAYLDRVLRGEISTYSMEKRYIRKSGTAVWINLTVSLVRDELDQPRYFISVIEDIDGRKRAEAERDALHALEAAARKEAEGANRAKMEFLSAMSHELRTPLNAVAGYVDLIEMGIHGPLTDAQRVALGRVRQNGDYLLGLINEILNFAKIEAGKIEYRRDEVALAPLVAETAAMMEPHLVEAGIEYAFDGSEPDVSALADADRVRQIVLNLLGNAVKFTPPGRRIEVSCGVDAGLAVLRVSDSGVGIAPEMLDRVFDPFVQVRGGQDRDPSRRGVGLGLAICRDLAEGMGGSIRVESTVGEGSTFTLSLPLCPARTAEARGATLAGIEPADSAPFGGRPAGSA
jgi:two-component system, sensor histidine kinase and response regulator